MSNVWVHYVLSLCLVASARAAAIASTRTDDGFWLTNLEAGKTFTFAIVPKLLGESLAVSFYSVDFTYTDCAEVEIDILDDGYVKRDYNKIAVICDAKSLQQFTAASPMGFHVVVKMGKDVNGGTIKARFVANSGTMVTSQRLYG